MPRRHSKHLATKAKIREAKQKVEEMEFDRENRNTRAFLEALNPLRLFLKCLGRMPYDLKKTPNGTNYFECSLTTPSTYFFLLTTLMYIFMLFDFAYGFYVSITAHGKYLDMCDYTWQQAIANQSIVMLGIVYSWICAAVIMSLYVYCHGQEFSTYFNRWLLAVKLMDMDISQGGYALTIISNIEIGFFLSLLLVLLATGEFSAIQDGFAILINVLVTPFFGSICEPDGFDDKRIFITEYISSQIHLTGTSPNCTRNRTAPCSCFSDVNTNACGAFDYYILWKVIGFSVFAISMIGSRSFMLQFRFLCHCMSNAADIWNDRVRVAMSGRKREGKEQRERRISYDCLMHDHLQIYHLYAETEARFMVILKTFYFMMFVNFILVLYYFALQSYNSTCEEAWHSAAVDTFRCKHFDDARERLSKERYTFANPCVGYTRSRLENAAMNLMLFFYMVLVLFHCMFSASKAFEKIQEGFDAIIRFGYTGFVTPTEQVSIRTLLLSFLWNQPFVINVDDYFDVSRKLLPTFSTVVMTYWILIIQFKPGEIITDFTNYEFVCNNYTREKNCCLSFVPGVTTYIPLI